MTPGISTGIPAPTAPASAAEAQPGPGTDLRVRGRRWWEHGTRTIADEARWYEEDGLDFTLDTDLFPTMKRWSSRASCHAA